MGEVTQYTLPPNPSNSSSPIGPPPHLPWVESSLTPLSSLSKLWNQRDQTHFSSARPVVSVLAAVLDIRPLRETLKGHLLAEWDLIDDSGVLVELVVWGKMARILSEDPEGRIRRGDVVFFGKVGLSLKSNQCLQLTPKDATSKIQICYRINQREIEDQAYLFHEAHRNLSRNAERVLKIVDWWNKKGYSR